MNNLFSFAVGLSRSARDGTALDCYFPTALINPDNETSDLIRARFKPGVCAVAPPDVLQFADQLPDNTAAMLRLLAEADLPLCAVRLDADTAISSTEEAYLKLHLLSLRLARPNSLNLENIFTHLPNNAWTTDGPIAPADLPAASLAARAAGRHLEVMAVDKFPKMTNYVVPTGVRIADAGRIRLGAYLGDGTTVMHEGFVNFNAGAIGPNMIEGRISQGVTVGAHSDLGGSSSTMGTLSGGGEIVISVGEQCLIGANAGTGIPLGDRCTIEAGLYITAGTKVTLVDENRLDAGTIKARELAGGSDLLFIRNSENGRIECRTNRRAIELNAQLHAHN